MEWTDCTLEVVDRVAIQTLSKNLSEVEEPPLEAIKALGDTVCCAEQAAAEQRLSQKTPPKQPLARPSL
jgi:hypothetical protein